ncbi:MAG: TOBE domain-containing protein, partial [Pseudomonadota bacterium]
QRVKTTSIYVTHDQIEAMTLADRVVILSEGNIEQVGRPIELYDHPDNLFVASFIGTPSMNLLDATVAKSDTGLLAVLDGGQTVALKRQTGLQEHQKVVIGMRPEHFSPGSDGLTLSGTTTLVEPTGAQTHVTFDLAGKSTTAVLDGGVAIGVGEPLIVSIDPAKIHVFDKETGRRV